MRSEQAEGIPAINQAVSAGLMRLNCKGTQRGANCWTNVVTVLNDQHLTRFRGKAENLVSILSKVGRLHLP